MTQRRVPFALQEHLDQHSTTTTRLLKFVLSNGDVYGLSMLDRDLDYDDGQGVVTYRATTGFDPSTLSADVGYSVDNAEGYALMGLLGVTTEMVERGELDDAQWIMYLINFKDVDENGDLIAQRHVILDAGDVGEVRTRYGMIWIPELLSYSMRLKQTIGSVWSRRCRAIFGSPAASQTGCGVDLTPLWVSGTVVSVGAESNRVFTGDLLYNSPGIVPFPGRIQFLTGNNAGKEFATEDIDGDTATLNETTPYAIEVGDTYRIRPDCMKRYREDCIDTWNNGPNFKGEPYIPVGDATQIQTPGAQVPNAGGWDGTDTEEEG